MDYKLTKIFDLDALQRLCDSITNMNGTGLGLLDLEGNIHVASGFSKICSHFHRKNEQTLKWCNHSDSVLALTEDDQNYKMYTCPNGMTDVAMPVRVGGRHIGNLFTGQLFLKEPDLEFFKERAQKFGFDEEAYLQAVKEAPVIDEEELKRRIAFLSEMTQVIADLGYKNIQRKEQAAELKKAKKNAEKIKEYMDYATSVGGIGTWEWNISTNKVYWNSETYRLHGLEPFSVEPDYALTTDMVHPEDREFTIKVAKGALKNKSSFTIDYRTVGPNNTYIICNTTGRVACDDNGEPVRITGTIQDVSERKYTVDKLKEANNLLEAILDAVPVPLFDFDMDGKIISLWNNAAERLLGWKKEEVLGKLLPPIAAAPEEDWQKFREWAKSDYSVKGLDVKRRKKDGTPIEYNVYASPLYGAEGKRIGTIAALVDITERNRIKQDLINAKERAEEANRLKMEFLNNLSHEIRTPMNGIVGFAEMIDKPGITEEMRSYYAKIVQNSAGQLLQIIDDILEISALNTKQEIVNETTFCLNELLTELQSIVQLRSDDLHSIPIRINMSLADEASYIISDKTKLHKILSNLLGNAIKFTTKGFIEAGYTVVESELKLYVKDTGIGISDENMDAIFNRFNQEEEEISRAYGGLGLGLSICRENAKLMGGNVTVESVKGEGSTFHVTIPYKQSDQKGLKVGERGIITDKKLSHRELTVLVAEDEEINFLFLRMLFENNPDHNFTVLRASNGQEAVDICFERDDIDLVLMDIKMPVMDGHEAAVKIKSKLPDLPIIAQTAYSTKAEQQFVLEHGCDDFVIKPVSRENLFRKIYSRL